MTKRPPVPPQFELFAEWICSSVPTPKLELPFQRSKEIDVSRVCKILGVSQSTVRRILDAKLIRAYRIDGSLSWRIEYDSVVDYCNQLRIHYNIGEDSLLRRPPHGRLRDEDLLPFPLAQTIEASVVERRLSISRYRAIYLIESGLIVGYQILFKTRASPWRIYRPSFDRYLASLHAQAAAAPRLHRAPPIS